MKKHISRRSFLKNTGLAAVASMLVSCAPTAAQPNPPTQVAATKEAVPTQAATPIVAAPTQAPAPTAESVQLQYWVAWSGKYANTWDKLKETPEFKDIVGSNVQITVKAACMASRT